MVCSDDLSCVERRCQLGCIWQNQVDILGNVDAPQVAADFERAATYA
jgi:hypothetical protein